MATYFTARELLLGRIYLYTLLFSFFIRSSVNRTHIGAFWLVCWMLALNTLKVRKSIFYSDLKSTESQWSWKQNWRYIFHVASVYYRTRNTVIYLLIICKIASLFWSNSRNIIIQYTLINLYLIFVQFWYTRFYQTIPHFANIFQNVQVKPRT